LPQVGERRLQLRQRCLCGGFDLFPRCAPRRCGRGQRVGETLPCGLDAVDSTRDAAYVADLGQLWERTTALPLPLGGIAAKRSLPEAVRRQVETLIRQSIEYAFAHPEASRAYIKEHAQELDDAVIDAHIALFVNDYSLSLGDEGRRAVEALTGIACAFNS